MTARPPRKSRARPATRRPRGDKAGAAEPSLEIEEVAARAARLGVTVERVLQEYARIAFADLRHIVEWRDGKLSIRDVDRLSAADAAPIHEIVGDDGGKVRVKLYDKKAALDAIGRHLGMFPLASRRREADSPPDDDAEDLREELKRRLARLAESNRPG